MLFYGKKHANLALAWLKNHVKDNTAYRISGTHFTTLPTGQWNNEVIRLSGVEFHLAFGVIIARHLENFISEFCWRWKTESEIGRVHFSSRERHLEKSFGAMRFGSRFRWHFGIWEKWCYDAAKREVFIFQAVNLSRIWIWDPTSQQT